MKGVKTTGPITPGVLAAIVALVILVLVTAVSLALGAGGNDDTDVPARDRVTSDSRGGEDEKARTKRDRDPADRKPRGDRAERETATPEPEPEPAPEQRPRSYVVTNVVDGDTIDLANGERVRLVGIDTPERGDCHSVTATDRVERLVLGKPVRLGASDEDRDRYGRLLRYVDIGDVDVGLRLIREGLAIARYDSRDGYGFHPREPRYVAADQGRPQRTCAASEPSAQPLAGQPAANCAEGYSPCVPPYPPDVDCADVTGPISVTGSDPHGLDRDGDRVACEWG